MMCLEVVRALSLEVFKHGLYNHFVRVVEELWTAVLSHKNKRSLNSLFLLYVCDYMATTPCKRKAKEYP
jgi:hypothetical protein